MGTVDDLPPPVATAIETWLRHHDELASGVVEGLYLVGSVALGDWQAGSDVDIVAVMAHPPSAGDVDLLRRADRAVVSGVLGTQVDGPFVTWHDLAHPPAPAVRPWTLDREFRHDDNCFELNPVVWTTLARHGLAVRGPDPSELDIHTDPDELRAFVRANTASYWRSIPTSIGAALDDAGRTEFSAALTSWSVLGVARMLFTMHTGEITSKSGAGRWLITELPHHRQLVEHALAIRSTGHPSTDDRTTVRATAELVTEVADRVAAIG